MSGVIFAKVEDLVLLVHPLIRKHANKQLLQYPQTKNQADLYQANEGVTKLLGGYLSIFPVICSIDTRLRLGHSARLQHPLESYKFKTFQAVSC